MRKVFTILLMAICFGATFSVLAEDAAPLVLTGYVDTSLFVDLNEGAGDGGQTTNFGLDTVELNITKEINGRASVRTDIEFTEGGIRLEQGFVTITDPLDMGLDIMFGKFNAPIGFEAVDAPDMYQFSHALVYDFGIPTDVVGINLSCAPTDKVGLQVYVMNGWNDGIIADNNEFKSVGVRGDIAVSETLALGLSGIAGPETAGNNDDFLYTLDADFNFTAVENLLIGGEVNFGGQQNATADGAATWFGFMAMGHYDFCEWLGGTLRFDFFDDSDGIRLGMEDTRIAITAAATFVIADGFGSLVEVRIDSSDNDAFVDSDGDPSSSQVTLAWEFTYSF